MVKTNLDMRFDKRLISRNLREGTLSREDYQARLESLEDSANQAERIGAAEAASKEESSKETFGQDAPSEESETPQS